MGRPINDDIAMIQYISDCYTNDFGNMTGFQRVSSVDELSFRVLAFGPIFDDRPPWPENRSTKRQNGAFWALLGT